MLCEWIKTFDKSRIFLEGYATVTVGYATVTVGYATVTEGYPSVTVGYATVTGGYPSVTGGYPSKSFCGYPYGVWVIHTQSSTYQNNVLLGMMSE
jgi:hypothetical protein